jgi:hypothetical protein
MSRVYQRRRCGEATNAAVQQAGLKPIHTVEIRPYHYASVFEKNSN